MVQWLLRWRNKKKTDDVFTRLFRGTPFSLDLSIFELADFDDIVRVLRKKGLDLDVDWKNRKVTLWL